MQPSLKAVAKISVGVNSCTWPFSHGWYPVHKRSRTSWVMALYHFYFRASTEARIRHLFPQFRRKHSACLCCPQPKICWKISGVKCHSESLCSSHTDLRGWGNQGPVSDKYIQGYSIAHCRLLLCFCLYSHPKNIYLCTLEVVDTNLSSLGCFIFPEEKQTSNYTHSYIYLTAQGLELSCLPKPFKFFMNSESLQIGARQEHYKSLQKLFLLYFSDLLAMHSER